MAQEPTATVAKRVRRRDACELKSTFSFFFFFSFCFLCLFSFSFSFLSISCVFSGLYNSSFFILFLPRLKKQFICTGETLLDICIDVLSVGARKVGRDWSRELPRRSLTGNRGLDMRRCTGVVRRRPRGTFG